MTFSRPGYTVNPVFSTDEAGSEEYVSDFSVQTRPQLRNGMAPDADTYFAEDEQGRFVFQEDDFSEEPDDGIRFDEDAYIEALLESEPDLQDSLQWAQSALPQEMIAEFNDAINNGDIDEINKQLEWLLTLYREENAEAFEDAEVEPITDEDFQEAYAGLTEQEPQGTELAFQYLQAAEQSDDPVYRDVAMATAEFHRGQMTAEEAINAVLERHSIEDAARIYLMMTQ